jgi:transposase, IS30 family
MPQTQLSVLERYVITHMHNAGFSNTAIGRRLGRHRATVGRELRRNRDVFGVYHYDPAQRTAEHRRTSASRRYKLDATSGGGGGGGLSTLGRFVRHGLRQRWSPQQIQGRLEREHRRAGGDLAMRISHETIYRFIYRRSQQGEHWHEQLRRRHKRRRSRSVGQRQASGGRGQIPGRVGIEERPACVDDRRRFGDWESDTVEGAKGTGLIATHVERKSRYTRLGKLNNKKAATLSAVSLAVLRDLPRKLRRTLTADNGKEFTDFASIERGLELKVYFANPHAPWERGANENTNGLLRDWFPKGSDFRKITNSRLAHVQRMLNNRPRKCLNYRTPREVLNALPGVALQS